MLVEQNTVMVEEREREIRQIVQSISDLNEIFRDLAGMVVEQVCGAVVTCSHSHSSVTEVPKTQSCPRPRLELSVSFPSDLKCKAP